MASARLAGLALACFLGAALFFGCPSDECADAPACNGARALNCIAACSVGPCSTGVFVSECGEGQCEVVPGDPASTRFSADRAVCAISKDSCDPSAQPICDGAGSVTGCSAYKRVITIPCSRAGSFFENARCCASGINETPDAGSPDGGHPDSGTVDGG